MINFVFDNVCAFEVKFMPLRITDKDENFVNFPTQLKCHVWYNQKYIRIMLELRKVEARLKKLLEE
jgi:hypothetical protein